MRREVTLPDIGAKNETIRISGWFVEVGESVFEGDSLLQALIPGVTIDIEAPHSGRLVEISKPIEAIVAPGEVLGWIEEAS